MRSAEKSAGLIARLRGNKSAGREKIVSAEKNEIERKAFVRPKTGRRLTRGS